MDWIRIEDLEVQAIIGTLPHERLAPQKFVTDGAAVEVDGAAGLADDFTLTFDYSAAEQLIYDFTVASRYQLLEALAENLAKELLAVKYIRSVRLRISKPGAARIARLISIEIERTAENL